jgi:hypothetical protein
MVRVLKAPVAGRIGPEPPFECEGAVFELNISGPLLTKFVNLRTVRDATMVDATQAGTLKMIDMIGLRSKIMKVMAVAFAKKAMMK